MIRGRKKPVMTVITKAERNMSSVSWALMRFELQCGHIKYGDRRSKLGGRTPCSTCTSLLDLKAAEREA